jgi:hypothetical protein
MHDLSIDCIQCLSRGSGGGSPENDGRRNITNKGNIAIWRGKGGEIIKLRLFLIKILTLLLQNKRNWFNILNFEYYHEL